MNDLGSSLVVFRVLVARLVMGEARSPARTATAVLEADEDSPATMDFLSAAARYADVRAGECGAGICGALREISGGGLLHLFRASPTKTNALGGFAQ